MADQVNDRHAREAEARADAQPAQIDIALTDEELQALLDSGDYEPTPWGLVPGQHFRKARGKGCYHLRISWLDGRGYLHWDRWDPRRYPVEHFFETPTLWGGTLAVLGLVGVVAVGAGRGA